MNTYIKSTNVNIHNGLLAATIEFANGLNFLSGENGTLKTKVLQHLKNAQERHLMLQPGPPCRRQAISPKRNAQRRAFDQIFQQSRRENINLEGLINERSINDAEFEKYASIGDLFYVVYDQLCKDGGNQRDKMKAVAEEFNSIITRVFPQYELTASWSKEAGGPTIEILKHKSTQVPLEGLSLGEQDILSLAMNIFCSRSNYDVFLVDEPEVHLNWHLEERLFDFLDEFCNEHHKQMIVVTHSRVVFKPRFVPKTQFLYWNENGKVSIGQEITAEQRTRIAGDAIEIIKLGQLSKPVVFVEDHNHAVTVEELAASLGSELGVIEAGNKANVRSLYRLSKTEEGWSEAYFLEDGDGEGSPFGGDEHFIHLGKYCMECYFVNSEVAASVLSCPEEKVKDALLEAIRKNKDKVFKKNKFFEFLLDYLEAEHLTPDNLEKLDVSEVMDSFLREFGRSFGEYVKSYIEECRRRGIIADVFPAPLIRVIEKAGSGI